MGKDKIKPVNQMRKQQELDYFAADAELKAGEIRPVYFLRQGGFLAEEV